MSVVSTEKTLPFMFKSFNLSHDLGHSDLKFVYLFFPLWYRPQRFGQLFHFFKVIPKVKQNIS